MKITVVVCTLNRCHSLAKTLNSVAVSSLPETIDWEVLVVDNNSSDQTREVVEDFSRRYPARFRYVFEPQPGKSFALNTGVNEARGEILAFVDDDVTVESAWLHNLTATLISDPNWAGAGGRTLLANPITPPRWLALNGPYSMGGVLAALFDLGSEPRKLDQAPYGANMAIRKTMFERYGLYRTDLGPSPNRDVPRPNEDTEFGRRLMAAGEQLRYEPLAVVYHPVIQDRVRKEYFLDWWFDFGRAAIRERGVRPPILGIPRYYFSIPKMMGWTAYTALKWMLALHPQRRFFLKAFVWFAAGQTAEVYRQSRRTGKQISDAIEI